MIDISEDFTKEWLANSYKVYVGNWKHHNWDRHYEELLSWLKSYQLDDKFVWDWYSHTFYFESEKMASMFILRWA